MTLSLLSPNQLVNSEASSSAGRRRKSVIDKETGNQPEFLHDKSSIQWNSHAQLQIYSSKLSQALRHLRMRGVASGKQPTYLPKRVRDAANRALAATAKGRSRWSRAIFASSVKPKLLKKNSVVTQQRKLTRAVVTGNSRLTKKSKATVPLPETKRSTGLPAESQAPEQVDTRLPETAFSRDPGRNYGLYTRSGNAGSGHECVSAAAFNNWIFFFTRPYNGFQRCPLSSRFKPVISKSP